MHVDRLCPSCRRASRGDADGPDGLHGQRRRRVHRRARAGVRLVERRCSAAVAPSRRGDCRRTNVAGCRRSPQRRRPLAVSLIGPRCCTVPVPSAATTRFIIWDTRSSRCSNTGHSFASDGRLRTSDYPRLAWERFTEASVSMPWRTVARSRLIDDCFPTRIQTRPDKTPSTGSPDTYRSRSVCNMILRSWSVTLCPTRSTAASLGNCNVSSNSRGIRAN